MLVIKELLFDRSREQLCGLAHHAVPMLVDVGGEPTDFELVSKPT